jgi:hypothetical protein
MTGREPQWQWVANPSERLGHQLIAFYLSGEIDYDSWLSEYFARVSEETAEDVLSEFGRAIDSSLADRTDDLMRLWDQRIAQTREANEIRPIELSAFAWWFVQTSLPLDWALDRLLEVLDAGARIDFPDDVVARLVAASQDAPAKAVNALGLIVRSTEHPWRIDGITNGSREILTTALGADDAEAQAAARRVIGELTMLHGRRDFRDLLPDTEM